MRPRFYVESPIDAGLATLRGAESHHLQHVMRAQIGDEVILLDGTGREYLAQVAHLGRSDVRLTIVREEPVDRELSLRLCVGVAFPKGERQRWLVEKMVELGVARIVPLHTSRSVTDPHRHSPAKLQRTVIEASKQCGRNRLLEIADTMDVSEYLQSAPPDAVRWLADPSGTPALSGTGTETAAYLAVGPEGGFTPAELAGAESAGWRIVSLGARTLRIETACLVLAALVAAPGRTEQSR